MNSGTSCFSRCRGCSCLVLLQGDVSAFDELYDGGYLGVPEAVLSEYLKPRSSPGSKDLAGIRLGVMHEWFDDCEPAVRDAAWAGFAALVARGATVVDVVRLKHDVCR